MAKSYPLVTEIARKTEKTQTAVETHNGALAILQAKGLV